MGYSRMVWFTRQKIRFAIDPHEIKGLEPDPNGLGSILTVYHYVGEVACSKVVKYYIDESFEEAYDRINGIEPFEDESLVKRFGG